MVAAPAAMVSLAAVLQWVVNETALTANPPVGFKAQICNII
jgi:hypothetical protein